MNTLRTCPTATSTQGYPPVEGQTCPPSGGSLRVRQADTAQGGRHVNRTRLQPCSRQLAS
jgi:hypothetical protein